MRRFVVTEITGWPISAKGKSSGNRKPTGEYYVLDSAYCYRIIASYKSAAGFNWRRDGFEQAAAAASLLNLEDEYADCQ